jgi:2,5-dihydroxypyridine 5,6-dioxygenase
LNMAALVVSAPGNASDPRIARGAQLLVADQMAVRQGEHVLITADSASDMSALAALWQASRQAGAVTTALVVEQLPYQGSLADPYIPDPVKAAVKECDVWIDISLPYMTGSRTHEAAMKARRARSLLAAGLDSGGLLRLYGSASLDDLYRVQTAFDEIIGDAVGKECRVTSPAGSDVRFTLTKQQFLKPRRAEKPGSFNVPGSAVMFPELESVKGVVVVEAVFHESYALLDRQLRVEFNGRATSIKGEGPHFDAMERAMTKAGDGRFGYAIHFTCGFQPHARFAGAGFIEATRSMGSNAIGFGLPSWENGEGGGTRGENHPDGLLTNQSLWIAGKQVVHNGVIVAPSHLVTLARAMSAG